MTGRARSARVRNKATGRVYWLDMRVGFRGREYNFGGGWRPTPEAAREAAEKSGTMREAEDQS